MSPRGKDRYMSDSEPTKAIKHRSGLAVKKTKLAEQLPLTRTRIDELLKSLERRHPQKEIIR